MKYFSNNERQNIITFSKTTCRINSVIRFMYLLTHNNLKRILVTEIHYKIIVKIGNQLMYTKNVPYAQYIVCLLSETQTLAEKSCL